MDKLDAIFIEAQNAAASAARQWLSEATAKYEVRDDFGHSYGTMMDMCGNAVVKVPLTTKFGKRFGNKLRLSMLAPSLDGRQEHGLRLAAANAARDVLNRHGIRATVWDYVD